MTIATSIAHFLAIPAAISAAGLLVAWVLYPGIIGLAARLSRGPALPPEVQQPNVSVVLATRASHDAIRARLDNLRRTRYPEDRLEIIVAHDRETAPETFSDLATGSRSLRFVPADEPGGKAAALNAGVRAATGVRVVFADTYQTFDEDTIPTLVAALERPGIAAATGSYDLAPGSNGAIALYWRFEKWLRRAESKIHSPPGVTGAVYAIDRADWRDLPAALILDDVYGPMQIVLRGKRIAFVESARAYETRVPTPRQEYSRKVRTLTGVIQVCMWLPQVLVPGRNPIWFQFACHKLLRLLTPYFVLFLGVWLVAAGLSVASPAATLIAASLATLATLAVLVGPWTRLRRLALEGALMQAAVVVAGYNGLRRNWRVWDA